MIENPIASPALGLVIAGHPVVLSDLRTRSSDCFRPHGAPEHAFGITPFMELARGVAIALVVIAGVLLTPRVGAASEDPADFIRIVGNQGLEVIRSGATLDQKATYFHRMLRKDFDLTDICRFVLGPYWRVASREERLEFRALFEDYLVRFYGQRFAQYNGESLRVNGSRTDSAGVIVTSQIIRPQQPPIEVDWQLVVSDGRYRISDINIGGVSMELTQRSEFAAIIQRNGGRVAGLLATIRETF